MSNPVLEAFEQKRVYLHENAKLKNGGRVAPQISVKEFEKILDDLKKKAIDRYFIDADDYKDDGSFAWMRDVYFEDMLPKFSKDVSKIDFDFENFEIEKKIFVTTSGIPYLRCFAGGDWQMPVRFFIYWDGKHLRGYVPTKGNVFNKKEKRAIEGDDDGYYVVNDIFPELAKKYGKKKINEYMRNFNYGSIDFQDEWCLEDFEHRLEVKEK